ILKPDGHGKLSKRDGDRLGFPVYAMNWRDPKSGELTKGFREMGFLPEAFVNMLALLGWNDGTEQEVFSIDELIARFSVDRISKGGAKFDFEKAKWFNHEWIRRTEADLLLPYIKFQLADYGIAAEEDYIADILELVRDRLVLLTDFWDQAAFFFRRPETYDLDAVLPKWNETKMAFFQDIIVKWEAFDPWHSAELESIYKLAINASGMKMGELMLPLRIMLVGGKFGPHVFDIAARLGREETLSRIKAGLEAFS